MDDERDSKRMLEMMLERFTEITIFAQAMMIGRARWEPFSGMTDRGEICVDGLRYATTLEDGLPIIGNGRLRAELERVTKEFHSG